MLNYLFTKTPLYFFIQSFWRDEAFTYLLAKKNIFELISLTLKDFNPPFYYVVIHFWMKFFGHSEISLRLVSLIMYWLTLYIAFLFLTNIFKLSTKKSALYLIFIAINPILLYYAFEARMYTMLAFFATFSLYAFYKKNIKTFIVATTLGLYTHYFMLFVLMGEYIYYFFSHKHTISKQIIIKYLVPLFIFAPWVLALLFYKKGIEETFWIQKSGLSSIIQMVGVVYSGHDMGLYFYQKAIYFLSFGLMMFVGYGLLHVRKKTIIEKNILLYLLIWGIGIPFFITIISFIKPIFFPRYVIFSSIGLTLLFVYLLEHMPPQVRYILLTILFLITINFHSQQIEFRKKSNLKKIFKEIKNLAKPNDVLYVTNELDYFPAEYYFDENRVFVYGKTYEEIPSYVGKVLIPKSHFKYSLPIYPNKAFILTSDTHYEIQAAK